MTFMTKTKAMTGTKSTVAAKRWLGKGWEGRRLGEEGDNISLFGSCCCCCCCHCHSVGTTCVALWQLLRIVVKNIHCTTTTTTTMAMMMTSKYPKAREKESERANGFRDFHGKRVSNFNPQTRTFGCCFGGSTTWHYAWLKHFTHFFGESYRGAHTYTHTNLEKFSKMLP